MIQWLRLYAPNAGGMGSIPSWRNKILHATQDGQEIKKEKKIKKKKKLSSHIKDTVLARMVKNLPAMRETQV